MLAFLNEHIIFILGFIGSTLAGWYAYRKSLRSDEKADDEFLFGSLNKVVEVIQADNTALRQRIIQLEQRIEQLEARIASSLGDKP